MAAGAVLLPGLHLLGPKLTFITYVPRSWWLSFGGGISVTYVFLHLLPELSEGSDVLRNQLGESALAGQAVWAIALVGLAGFYGIESEARRSRGENTGERSTPPLVYAVSIISYGVYNALIGYLLHDQAERGVGNSSITKKDTSVPVAGPARQADLSFALST